MTIRTGKKIGLIILVLAALLSLGYALLPWLLPTGIIKNRIADQLHELLGRPVTVGRLALDWKQGIQLSDLAIQNPPQVSPVPLITIGSIQTDFSPIDLLRGRIKDLSIQNIQILLQIESSGRTNIDDILTRLRQLPPNQNDLHIDRFQLDSARLTLNFPADPGANAIFDLTSAAMQNSLNDSGLTWAMQLHLPGQKPSVLAGHGSFGKPSINDKTNAENKLQISLDQFDLSLPALKYLANLVLASGTPPRTLDQFGGLCSLRAQLTLLEHNLCDIAGRFELENVNLRFLGEPNPTLENAAANLNFKLQYDPATGVTRLASLDTQLPGLTAALSGHYDPRPAAETVQISLREGTLNPETFLTAAPALSQSPLMLGLAPTFKGDLKFDFDFSSSERQQTSRLHFDATPLGLIMVGLYKKPGDSLVIDLQSLYDRDKNQWQISPAKLDWLSLHLGINGVIPEDAFSPSAGDNNIPFVAKWSRAQDRGLTLNASLNIDNVNDLRYVSEHLFDFVPGLTFEGPIRTELKIADQTAEKQTTFVLQLPQTTQCELRDMNKPDMPVVFAKPANKPFEFRVIAKPTSDTDSPKLVLQARAILEPAQVSVDNTIVAWQKNASDIETVTANINWAGLEDWLAALPAAQNELQRLGLSATGHGLAKINLTKQGADEFRCEANVSLDQTALRFDRRNLSDPNQIASTPSSNELPLLQKPAGQPAALAMTITRANTPAPSLTLHGTATIADLNAQINAESLITAGPDHPTAENLQPKNITITLNADKLETLPDLMPGLFSNRHIAIGSCTLSELAGQANAQLQADLAESEINARWACNAEKTAFNLTQNNTRDTLLKKPVGQPCQTQGLLKITRNSDGDSQKTQLLLQDYLTAPATIELRDAGLQLGQSSTSLSGQASFNGGNHASEKFQPQNYLNARLKLHALIDHSDDTLKPLLQNSPLSLLNLIGTSQADFDGTWDQRENTLSLAANLDLTQTGLAAFGGPLGAAKFNKPTGDPLKLNFAARASADLKSVQIDKLQAVMIDNTFALSAAVEGVTFDQGPNGQKFPHWQRGRLTAEIKAPRLDQPAAWCGAISSAHLAGAINAAVEASLDSSASFPLKFETAHATAAIDFQTPKAPVRLTIADLEYSPAKLLIPAVYTKIGDNSLTAKIEMTSSAAAPLTLALENDPNTASNTAPQIRIDVQADKLDLDDLSQITAAWNPSAQDNTPPDNNSQSPNYQQIIAFLRRLDLQGTATAAAVSYTDAKVDTRLTLEELRSAFQLRAAKFDANFIAGLNAGVVNGAVNVDLTKTDPPITFDFTSKKLRADENIQPLVQSEFPGMEVNGFVSEKYTWSNTLDGLIRNTADWQGTGTTICEKGVLFGPAGPAWMLKTFPGLKLVEYPWQTMTNKYEKFADGSKKNYMLFSGDTYDIYLNGSSVPVREQDRYPQVIALLETDLAKAKQELADLDSGDLKLTDAKSRQVRLRAAGLERLWQRHQNGQKLPITEINYITGALVSSNRKKDFFDKPTEWLRLPIFRYRGYIIGQFMIDLKTTNPAML